MQNPSIGRAEIAGVRVANTVATHDEELAIDRTLQGDLNAFNEPVFKYERIAYTVAYRMLQSRDAASDAVQESFIKAFRALSSFKGSSFKGWLMRIVINTCYDVLRLNSRFLIEDIDNDSYEDGERSFPHLVDSQESPQAFVERMELNAQLELGLRALPKEQRVVLILCDIHGYRYEEISEITGMTMGTVKSRLSRARQKLRDFLLRHADLESFGLRN